jgi:hypothetical protein
MKPHNPAQTPRAEFEAVPLDDGNIGISLTNDKGVKCGIVVPPSVAIEVIAVGIIKAAAAATAIAMLGEPPASKGAPSPIIKRRED